MPIPVVTRFNLSGVDVDLIKRFYVILQVLATCQDINLIKFEEYARETAEKYVELYPWYPMPPTVHKVLFHGKEVMEKYMFPIGMYSEEAQEALNKIVRNSRLDHARKISRVATMTDQFHFLLINSDPKINHFRTKKPKRNIELLSEAKLLLHSTEDENEEEYEADFF